MTIVVGSGRRQTEIIARSSLRQDDPSGDSSMTRSGSSQIARITGTFHRFVRSSNSRSIVDATAKMIDRLLLESLILAQDERWRRA